MGMDEFLCGGPGMNERFIESVDERNPRSDACDAIEMSTSGELGELMKGGSGLRDPASIDKAAFSWLSPQSRLLELSPLSSFFIDFIFEDMHRKISCGFAWSNLKVPSPVSHFLPASKVNFPSR